MFDILIEKREHVLLPSSYIEVKKLCPLLFVWPYAG
jgi:hypothetical protein